MSNITMVVALTALILLWSLQGEPFRPSELVPGSVVVHVERCSSAERSLTRGAVPTFYLGAVGFARWKE